MPRAQALRSRQVSQGRLDGSGRGLCFGGASPSALGMWGPAPLPRVWLLPAYAEPLRSDWGCTGERRQHLPEGAQGLQSKTEIIFLAFSLAFCKYSAWAIALPAELSILLSNLLANSYQIWQRPRGPRERVLQKFHENVQLDKAGRILHPPLLREPAGRASTTLRALRDPTPPSSGAGLAARCSDMASTCHLVFLSRLRLPKPAAGREAEPTARFSCKAGGAAATPPRGPPRAAGQEGAARLPSPKAEGTPWARPSKPIGVSARGQWSPPGCCQGCPVPFPGAAGDAFCFHLLPVAL